MSYKLLWCIRCWNQRFPIKHTSSTHMSVYYACCYKQGCICVYVSTALSSQIRYRGANWLPCLVQYWVALHHPPALKLSSQVSLRGLQKVGGFHTDWLTPWGFQSSMHNHPFYRQQGEIQKKGSVCLCVFPIFKKKKRSDISLYCGISCFNWK